MRMSRSINIYNEKIMRKHEIYQKRQDELIKLFPEQQAKQLKKHKSIYITKDQKFKCITCGLNSDTYDALDEIIDHQKTHRFFFCI